MAVDLSFIQEQERCAMGRRDTAVFAYQWREGIVPGPQQYAMARRIDDDSIQYQADFWPRDHGKSEVFCIAYPLRRICEDPNVRILLVQKTLKEAKKTLSVIKSELEANVPMKTYYREHWQANVGAPDISNATGAIVREGRREGAWQQQMIYVKRSRLGKDPTVEAVGVGGAITGGHFDIIILDDVEEEENTKTESRLDDLVEWFSGTILQLREPHTKIIVVGTLKTAARDIYNVVLSNPMWNCKVVSALVSHELGEIDYEPVMNHAGQIIDVRINTPDVVTLWPERWPIKVLILDMLASLRRSTWIREKLNDLRAAAGRVFKKKWFRYVSLAEMPSIFDIVVQAWDTAYEKGQENDYSACVTVGFSEGHAYILSVYRAKLDFDELKSAVMREYAKWRPDRVLIEDKASGKSAVQVLIKETRLPIVPVKPGGNDKTARANAVTVYFETGRVLFSAGAPWLDDFEDELVLFPRAANDDMVDALVYGLLDLFILEDGSTVDTVTLQEAIDRVRESESLPFALGDSRFGYDENAGRPMLVGADDENSEFVVVEFTKPTPGFVPVTIDEREFFTSLGWSKTVRREAAQALQRAHPGLFTVN